ncbi:mannose-6-phosphate isomerase, class I [Novipirellula artificiosorum]|uniref:mannose-6-phosphate isomerase n=1 Tax=Novipirellula artificiosorum TaxID=2528016 RepID=A0A5C6DQP5_9BACT|nr:mannose-6-phosphate isomerase, class I [Novipirellula artificiosorum]TWU39593.1 Mannose-6-phosphate isomerase [Novipirellula artificiosorum]
MKPLGLLKIRGVVQHYDWGGFDFIPHLLGQPELSAKPCAELWMGSHANGPSVVQIDDATLPLPELIARSPRQVLGERVAERFANRLPYLFKVLDARKMLSIQAHPSLSQAAEGFEKEELAGVSITSPNRNYKDRNHKPEVHVALTDFWMLHGFRPLEEIADTLDSVPELQVLMPDFREQLVAAGDDPEARAALLRTLYEQTMTMPQSEVDRILDPLLQRLDHVSDKDDPNFWAARAAREFPLPDGHRDRGIFSIYLLNLVRLKPGEATYQPAGTLHAYLEGVNVELMANSDNVMRGGLTPKHVDVAELMSVLCFNDGSAEKLRGQSVSDLETTFPTPAEEFELSRIELAGHQAYHSGVRNGPEILIVMKGSLSALSGDQSLQLKAGEILLAPQTLSYTLDAGAEPTVLFKASTPTR